MDITVLCYSVCVLFDEPEQTGNHFFITWGSHIGEQKRRSQWKCEEWIKEWMKTRTGCWENRGQTSVREFTVGILNAFSDHWLRWTKEWTLVYEKRRGYGSTSHITYTGLNSCRGLKTQWTAACHLILSAHRSCKYRRKHLFFHSYIIHCFILQGVVGVMEPIPADVRQRQCTPWTSRQSAPAQASRRGEKKVDVLPSIMSIHQMWQELHFGKVMCIVFGLVILNWYTESVLFLSN